MGKLKLRFRLMGLKDVNWNKYDFHITPVLTFTRVQKEKSIGWCLVLEWGHWAAYVGLFSIQN
jgi:hypothetical protein